MSRTSLGRLGFLRGTGVAELERVVTVVEKGGEPSPADVEALISCARDNPLLKARLAATGALHIIGQQNAALRKRQIANGLCAVAAKDPEAAVRQAAILALSEFAATDGEVVRNLQRLVLAVGEQDRPFVIRSLQWPVEMAGDVAGWLVGLLLSGVRQEDCQAILSTARRITAAPVGIESVLERAYQSPDPWVRHCAVGICGLLGEVLPQMAGNLGRILVKALDDPSKKVREEAICALTNWSSVPNDVVDVLRQRVDAQPNDVGLPGDAARGASLVLSRHLG